MHEGSRREVYQEFQTSYDISTGGAKGYVCMYVYMYRGCPSWNCPLLRAVQLGQGEGLIGIVGPISQPHGTIDTASLTLDRTYALVCVF